jgi:hypothetical protein
MPLETFDVANRCHDHGIRSGGYLCQALSITNLFVVPRGFSELRQLILEKVEVKILRKSISYLKENPTDRTFKVLASSLIPPPAINFRISRFFDLVVLKMISSMVSFSTMFQWFGFPGR